MNSSIAGKLKINNKNAVNGVPARAMLFLLASMKIPHMGLMEIGIERTWDVADMLFVKIFDVLFYGADRKGKCLFSFLLVADTAGV